MIVEILSVTTIAMLLLEGIKTLYRKVIVKDDSYDFSVGFYTVAIPVLNLLLQPFMVWLGLLEVGVVTLDALGYTKLLVTVLLESLGTVFVYENTLKPLKEYSRNK